MRYNEASPVAQRILAIDDEIATLDGAVDATVLWSGVALFALALFGMLLAVLGTDQSELGFLLIGATIASAPLAILGLYLTSNRAQRRRLERELDSLIHRGRPS